jgi:hypothetical protein
MSVLCYASNHLSCYYPSYFCFIVLYVLVCIWWVLWSVLFLPVYITFLTFSAQCKVHCCQLETHLHHTNIICHLTIYNASAPVLIKEIHILQSKPPVCNRICKFSPQSQSVSKRLLSDWLPLGSSLYGPDLSRPYTQVLCAPYSDISSEQPCPFT